MIINKDTCKVIFTCISVLGSLYFFLFVIILSITLSRSLSLQLLISLFLAYVMVSLNRLIYFKERPKKKKHTNIFERIDASSFPSMHSVRISLLSLFLTRYFRYSIIITIVMLLASIAVYFSRYYLKKHYVTDIIGGIAFGMAIFYIMTILNLI